jgi:septal ring factor EnvC (AmiA/AmiB activator)
MLPTPSPDTQTAQLVLLRNSFFCTLAPRFRARQSGRPEPPTAVQALDDGDEVARTWNLVRNLGQQLVDARERERQTRQDLAATRRDLDREQRQWGWLEVENARLRADIDRLGAEVTELEAENTEIRDELSRDCSSTTRLPTVPPSTRLARAERRRLEREHRKRRDQ